MHYCTITNLFLNFHPNFSSWGYGPGVLRGECRLVGPWLPDLWNDCRAASIPGTRRASQSLSDGEKDSERMGGIWWQVQHGGERPLFFGKFTNHPTASWVKPQLKTVLSRRVLFPDCSCWPRTQNRGWVARAQEGEKYSHILSLRKSTSGCWRQDLLSLHLNLMWVLEWFIQLLRKYHKQCLFACAYLHVTRCWRWQSIHLLY